MFRRFRVHAVSGILLAVLCCVVAVASNAKEESDRAAKDENQTKPGLKKIAMKAFMRKKLASSQDIIEGLALEDFALIAKGAKQLKAMSVVAEFMSINDPTYVEHADEFRRTVSKLEKSAKEKQIDGATLGFMDMTMKCVECHKFVRTIPVEQ